MTPWGRGRRRRGSPGETLPLPPTAASGLGRVGAPPSVRPGQPYRAGTRPGPGRSGSVGSERACTLAVPSRGRCGKLVGAAAHAAWAPSRAALPPPAVRCDTLRRRAARPPAGGGGSGWLGAAAAGSLSPSPKTSPRASPRARPPCRGTPRGTPATRASRTTCTALHANCE